MPAAPTVIHNPAAGRFEAHTEHGVAILEYVLRGDVMDLVHTEVPQEAEGQGIGAALVRAALDHARNERIAVIPSCPYVRAYLERHPDFGDLVAAR
jgi:predicted GNAT family acetyltransferase